MTGVIKLYNLLWYNCLNRSIIFFTRRYNIINEWIGVALLLPWEKKFLYFIIIGDLIFVLMRKYDFFDLAFQMFICLGSFVPLEIFFTPLETTQLPVKGCKFWTVPETYGRWDDSLACYTYCDKGHQFIVVICEEPWHSHLLPSVWQYVPSLPVLTTKVCRDWDSIV